MNAYLLFATSFFFVLQLNSGVLVNANLNITNVRLVNGSGSFGGRVEVSLNGVWGTFCDDSFDINDAKVICRMLNLSASAISTNARFGQGTGPVFAHEVRCFGYETHLKDCTFITSELCSHDQDVGVFCTECGEVDITHGEGYSISKDGSELTISCYRGFRSDVEYTLCQDKQWTTSSITCVPDEIQDVRLEDGLGLYDGRVELLVNNTWGTVCADTYTHRDVWTICYVLFGTRSYLTSYSTSTIYNVNAGPTVINQLGCGGYESNLNECDYKRHGTCSQNYLAVACNKSPLNVTGIRLVYGTGPYDGRVELMVDGHWGTICNKYIGLYDAMTFCNMLNLSLATYFKTTMYGEGTGPVLTQDVRCYYGAKDHINNCYYQSVYSTYCNHKSDLSIVCTACGPPNIINGDGIAFNGRVLTVKCETGYYPEEITMTCLENGTWTRNQTCNPKYVFPLSIEDIRLAGSNWPSEGRVEILVNQTWGTICAVNFNQTGADVICNMLGLAYETHYVQAREDSLYRIGSGPIYIDELQCNGTEGHINNCTYDLSNSCTHYDDLALVCTGYQLNITGIRLAGTPGPYHGRVEILVNDTWGTISDVWFYHAEASTVCNMFGLRYKEYLLNSYYGPGTGPNFIYKLDCTSYYGHINDCKYVVDLETNTLHTNDASVICYGPTLNITDARLANGTGPFDGRAEIKVNDTWGTICDNNFNIRAADLFCKILGLSAVQIFTGAIYGEGNGPIFMDQVFCETYDVELKNCRYLYLNSCSHAMDVSVVCNECGEPDVAFWGPGYFTFNGSTLYADCSYYRNYIGTLKMTCDNETKAWVTKGECQEYSYPLDITDLRLAGGPRFSSGRVEIKSLETWGTVCDHSFGMSEANAVCQMLGYAPAVTFYTGAYYGEGKGPIFIDDLNCIENAADLNNCTYATYDNCNHGEDVSVICTDCGDPKPINGLVNTSSSSYGTYVHIKCEENYLLIGESDIFCQLNGSWSGHGMCKLIDCGDATPEHGFSNTTLTTNGTVVEISCKAGYNISGETVIFCKDDEQWTDLPSCKIIDCKEPYPEHAEVTLTNNKTTFGETAVITCWDGYTSSSGSPTVLCIEDGTWEEWLNCVPIDCGSPVPTKGSANTTDTFYGTVLKIICPPNYNITGNSVITCQADGTWSDTPVCDTSDCGLLSVPNGEASITNGTSIGAIATIKCDEGYSLIGPSIAVCSTLGWNDSFVCEIQKCDDPVPTYGKVTSTDGSSGYVFGNYAEIQCSVGYDLKGDNVITCGADGVWSDLPSCELKDCGNLSVPADGRMDDFQGTKYQAQVVFECNDGYLLVGEDTTTCNEQGEWTNPAPTCVKKSNVGDACLSVEYCLLEYSKCVNSVCICVTGIYDKTSQKCDIMPLLPYGTSEGDSSLSKGQSCSAKVTFELGFPVFNKLHKDVFVCWYGYMAIDTVYANPTSPSDKNSISGFGDNNILAPFNAPISIENSGAVFYRSFDIRNSYEKMKENEKVISYVELIVRKLGDTDSFVANFVLIATWDKARPLPGFEMSKPSTFQAVLTSDGKTTYVFYIYGHGQMQWMNTISSNPRVWVGNSVNTKAYIHPYSFSDSVLHLDSKLSISSSEEDVSGLVFQPLMDPGKVYTNAAVDCVKWYNENYEDKKRMDFIASMTPECPCDIWLSRFDPWFWKIGLQRRRTDITFVCVDMLHVGIFGHYGKSCCYDLRSWLWVYERPYAGGFQLYNTRFPLQNILNDVIPKTKCCYQSDFCNLYYELRPTGSCYKTSPYDFGTFWGDPHFRTLDGLNFTFNGLGEYVLLQIRGNKTFDLQARTERPLKDDGSLSEATVFTAFAAKDSTDASVHVELNREKTGIILYGNKVDLTTLYYDSNDSEDPFEWTSDENNLIISKRDQTLSVLFPSFGIALNISVSLEMLSLIALVNKTLKGNTQGLLGNYNGNPEDDFILPNGTVLNSNLTERDVFNYGQTWAVETNNSAFIYEKGKSHSDYHNDSYVPKFLDEADKNKVDEAIKECNGSQNIQCVFDFVFTNKPEVALMTNSIKAESDITRSELDVSLPAISVCRTIKVNKGEEAACNFTAAEDDDVYFVENNVNATINRNSSLVIFTMENEDPTQIRIASRNKKGRSSTALVIDVLLCTKCNDHGNCTDYPRDSGQSNEYFKLAACVCEPEYEGPDCEKEFNGCAANPCSLNRTCIKLSPKDQKLLGRSYNCTACPDGYSAVGSTECTDIDECDYNTDNCQHICTNTEGGFECSCRAGYTIDSQNQSQCKDINECEEALHNCTYRCNNTEGSFNCGCFPGYILDTDTGSCSQDENVTCSRMEADACAEADGCSIENDGPVCFCKDGYELDDSGKLCRDIDECNRGICPHECVNTNDSFECMCYPGYKLEGRTVCKECDILHWGENCTNDCICTGRGANRCDNVKGCICDEGWEGDTCNIDINECVSSTQPCNDSRRQCVNNLGSYTCECKTGFTESEQGTCEDTDECSDPRLNECSQLCENTFGSYSCKCKSGYTKENETACVDIDECEVGISLCDQICVNNPGKHSCACNFGYTLSDDRMTCIKISDPCLEIYNLTCSHFCLVESNSAKCACRPGYRLNKDNSTCIDINECEEAITNTCDDNANCTNTDGSFLCDCPVGMLLENNGRSCSECDSYHYGKNCLQNCSCLYGVCDKKTGCVCNKGWGGLFCDSDIDECDNGELTCLQENTICVNTLGSARCSCKTGYTNSSGRCIDINECSDIHQHSCDQICNNTEGGYICSCRQGFVKKENCEDINECAGSHGCDQVCVNTPGSYKCSCEVGFILDLTNRKSCKPEYHCSQDEINTCPNSSTCLRYNNKTSCTCNKGYQKTDSGNICEDIDECKRETTPCSHNCTNTNGSFICTCNTGQYLLEDEVTCQECRSWTYGPHCANDCTCNITNANSCDPVSGSCYCKAGWNGDTCNADIDECLEETSCPNNSVCINSNGSYSCKCNIGYFKTGGSMCAECDPRHFGEDCQMECLCDTENTHDCDHENGDCICKEGWTGETCREDVVECEIRPGICRDKSNSTCKNSIGSYKCECDIGFIEANGKCEVCEDWMFGENCILPCVCVTSHSFMCDATTGECICKPGWNGTACENDIDECEFEGICQDYSSCENSDGSFDCICNTGYSEHENATCQVCKQWYYGKACEEECLCVEENTETCNHMTGNCSCKTGWKGTTCSIDINECTENQSVCLVKTNSTCQNTNGSYICNCDDGFYEQGGVCTVCNMWNYGKQCEEECECVKENTETCNHVTGNCSCKIGWNGTTCSMDIDECTENTSVCLAKTNSTCKNLNGSYSCDCDDGFYELGDVCTVCEKWHYGNQCEEECLCDQEHSETCNHVTGKCSCKHGWRGTTCSIDIDECTKNASVCLAKANSTCQNTNGSYICVCDDGFYEQGHVCTVCEKWHYGKQCEEDCLCDQENTETCNHVTGNCSCKIGWKGTTCSTDIDECIENPSVCLVKTNSTCKNTNGSYICDCDEGFYEQEEVCTVCEKWHYDKQCGKECLCDHENSDTCDHVTGNCSCKTGWKGTACTIDIDECTVNASVCLVIANSTCQNTDGSYSCDCDDGFREQGGLCTDCSMWTFGKNCDQNCTCDTYRSQHCDPADGRCICNRGWTGTDCKQDMDECMIQDICPIHSSCNNTIGSFNCECYPGYHKLGEDKCQECLNNTYGDNCTYNCICNVTNAENEDQSCDKVTGDCICKSSWGGNTCNEDVDECKQNKTLCNSEDNKTCVNTEGWYECDCVRGFTKQPDGGACVEDSGHTTQRPADRIAFDMTVTFSYDLPNDTNLNSSKIYEDLRSKCIESLRAFLGQIVSEAVQIIVNDIRIGSVEVDYTIVYGTTDSVVATELAKAVLELQQGSYLIFDGQNVSASSDTFKNMEPCTFYNEAIGGCSEGFTCEVEDGAPTCRQHEDESKVNWSLVIGLSGAGIFLLILTVVLLVVTWNIFVRRGMRPDLEQRLQM